MTRKILYFVCLTFLTLATFAQNRLESNGNLPNYLQNIYNGKNFDSSPCKTDYQKEQNEMIRSLILSGKIVYGDPISDYLNKITDNLITDNRLRSEIKIYTLKNSQVNAAATVDGFVFVNVGLVAQCETESELAFVIAHEIAHYVKKHGEKTKKEREKSKTINDFLSRRYRSREEEREADETGYTMFYANSQYIKSGVSQAFDVLEFGYLPFDEITVSRNSFETEYWHFDDKYFLTEVTPITRFIDEVDTLSTHPNLNARRETMREIIGNDFSSKVLPDEKNNATFNKIRKLAQYEVIRLQIAADHYLQAYYNARVMNFHGDNSQYLKAMTAAALYGIASAKVSGEYSYIDLKKEDVEGELQRIAWFFKQITRNECALLSLRTTWAALENEPENTYLNSIFNAMVGYLNSIKSLNSLNKFSDFRQGENIEQNADTANISKYDKLKNNSVKVGTQAGFKTENYMLADLKQNAEFVKKFNAAMTETKRKETGEFIAHYSETAKTDVKKLLILTPYVINEASSKNENLHPKSFEQQIVNVAKRNGFEPIIISENNQTLPCSYSALSRLNDYAGSLNRFSEEIFETYNTDLLQTELGNVVINLVKYTKSPVQPKSIGNKYYKRIHTLLSLIDLPALPVSIIQWCGQKRYGTVDFIASDLATGKKLYQTSEDFVTESTPDELKQELYDCYATLSGKKSVGYLGRRLHLLVDTRISPSGYIQKYKAEPTSLLHWNYFIQPSIEYVLNRTWVLGASFQYQTPFKYEPKINTEFTTFILPATEAKILGGSFYSKIYFSEKAPVGYYFKMQADYFNLQTKINEVTGYNPNLIVQNYVLTDNLKNESSNYLGFRLETGRTIVLANHITLNTGISFGLLTTGYKDWTRDIYPIDCANTASLTNYLFGVNIGIGFLAF